MKEPCIFYGLLRIFLENWENHFKFVGAYCIYCLPLSVCLWLWACMVNCGVHN